MSLRHSRNASTRSGLVRGDTPRDRDPDSGPACCSRPRAAARGPPRRCEEFEVARDDFRQRGVARVITRLRATAWDRTSGLRESLQRQFDVMSSHSRGGLKRINLGRGRTT